MSDLLGHRDVGHFRAWFNEGRILKFVIYIYNIRCLHADKIYTDYTVGLRRNALDRVMNVNYAVKSHQSHENMPIYIIYKLLGYVYIYV